MWLVEETNLESESRSWDLGRPGLALGENQSQKPAGKLLQDPGQKVFPSAPFPDTWCAASGEGEGSPGLSKHIFLFH